MKKKWTLHNAQKRKKRLFPELENATEENLILRGIQTEEQKKRFFDPDYDHDSHDPFLLLDMKEAVERFLKAIDKNEKVCVYGDYDADGVTSSAILVDFLEKNEMDVISYIPDRNKEGYALNNSAIDYICEQKTKLIVTVDCGVSNREEVEYAKEKGIDVVILDHHHVPQNIPEALAVVDPKRDKDKYPDKNLAGVGVAFKFVQALSSKISTFDAEQLKWYLDLVAIGTIADCVPLEGENRMLVKYGLLVLSKTKRVGLRQLFHVGRIAISESSIPSADMVAFQIAPRINAAGRMDHANIAQDLLLCKQTEEAKARLLALELEEKNKHRQKETKQIVKEARAKYLESKKEEKIIIATSPHWSLGLVGLAAGRIMDEFGKPTILLKEFDGHYKGSGRSIPGFNLVEALEKHGDLLLKYGGHAQAAGLQVPKESFEILSKELKSQADLLLEDIFEKTIKIDHILELKEINKKLLEELNQFEPFGKANKKPLFLTKKLTVKEKRDIGKTGRHIKLQCTSPSSEFVLDSVGFNLSEQTKNISDGDLINLVYHLDKNYWNGQEKIQARIIDIEKIIDKKE